MEGVVLARIKELAQSPEILPRLVAETNRRLRTELPQVQEQRNAKESELTEIRSTADGLMNRLAGMNGSEGGTLIAEKLDELGTRRREIEGAIGTLDLSINQIRREAVNENEVRTALTRITEIYDGLRPYERKELIRLVLIKAEVSDDCLKLAFRGRPPEIREERDNRPRSETPDWLGGLMSQSPQILDIGPVGSLRI